jgi:mitochondrial fission protein ELM1
MNGGGVASRIGPPLKVLVLKDRRPGEHRKAEGLAAIIARMTDADVQAIEAGPRRFARNRVRLWALTRAAGDPARALLTLYGIDPTSVTRPDIVIAAGRPTAAAAILLKRLTGAKLFYVGWLRDYDPADFDLMLVGSPRQANEPNCALAPLPCLIDPERLGSPRPLRSEEDLRGALLSLVLGGPRTGYAFAEGEWRAIGALVAGLAARYRVRWRVANSRRTPARASDMLKNLAGSGVVEQFIDIRAAGAASLYELFAADAVVVTEDSLTMMSEGLAAMRPVVALKPQLGLRHGYPEELVHLAGSDAIAILPIRAASPQRFVRLLLSLSPPAQDARDVIAAAVAPHLGL